MKQTYMNKSKKYNCPIELMGINPSVHILYPLYDENRIKLDKYMRVKKDGVLHKKIEEYMNKNKYKSPYNCPSCGWDSGGEYKDVILEDCYYKFEGDELKVISMDDLIECEQDPPEDYYPKMSRRIVRWDGSGYDWTEFWLCPHCKKEFSFVNGT